MTARVATRPRYRAGDAKPTHCMYGHEYTPDNTRSFINDTGRRQRVCLKCLRVWRRKSYDKHKAKRRAYGREYDARYRAAGRKKRVGATAVRVSSPPLHCNGSTNA